MAVDRSRRSSHTWAATRLNAFIGTSGSLHALPRDDGLVPKLVADDASPEARVLYARLVNAAWNSLGVIVLLVTVALGLLAHALGGHAAAVPVGSIGVGVGFYCVTGALAAVWHIHLAKQAGRRARREGRDSPRVRASMDRTLPGRGVTILQVVVGVLAAVIAVTTL